MRETRGFYFSEHFFVKIALLEASWEPFWPKKRSGATLVSGHLEEESKSSIFDRFWGHLGVVLGPSWGAKMDPKWDPKRAFIASDFQE